MFKSIIKLIVVKYDFYKGGESMEAVKFEFHLIDEELYAQIVFQDDNKIRRGGDRVGAFGDYNFYSLSFPTCERSLICLQGSTKSMDNALFKCKSSYTSDPTEIRRSIEHSVMLLNLSLSSEENRIRYLVEQCLSLR